MKGFFRHRFIFFLCVSLQMWIVSCTTNDNQDPFPDDGGVQLAIHITPVSGRAVASSGNRTTEMIKSLRLILIGTDSETGLDSIEFNRFIQVESPGGIPATDFRYDFLWRTKKGKKTFFMIANEESVSGMSYSGITLSGDAPTSLSELLKGYEGGKPAGNLATMLQSAYYYPTYDTTSDGNIFLPYTSVYGDIDIEENDSRELSMYIVPVAAKFIFNFTNNRSDPVSVEGISLSYINTANYLLGNVGRPDSIKSIEGENYYWVDWLAKVSALSWEHTEYNPNMGFNDKYGWITDYSVPTSDYVEKIFVAEEESFDIDGITENEDDPLQPTPGTYTLGPLYVPESKNFLNPETNKSTDYQGYYLTIKLKDTVEGKEAPDFENVYISNLQALFRNTCVIINIDMSQGKVEVYAEIADWNYNDIRGWVTEGSKPGFDL